MIFHLDITKQAERDLKALDPPLQKRIDRAILLLEQRPRPMSSQRLQGLVGYRLRVGDYRVLYTIDYASGIITIYRVKHRREVYRG